MKTNSLYGKTSVRFTENGEHCVSIQIKTNEQKKNMKVYNLNKMYSKLFFQL